MAGKRDDKKSLTIRKYRFRLILTLVGLAMMGFYRLTRLNESMASGIYEHFNRPLHDRLATLCDSTDSAVIEILIACLCSVLIAYTIISLVYIIRDIPVSIGSSFERLISLILTFIMTASLIYGGFCILWGYYYFAPGVKEICGIEADPDGVLHEDLIRVDERFLLLANEYSNKVLRDSDGVFKYKGDPYDHSSVLYDAISDIYPGLDAPVHRPKPFHFSRVLSYMDFAGFFSPFTGEACINDDSPACMTPSSIAHELAHQRGIGAEDEANFVAVIACLEDGDPDYVYSASLLALTHLQNALYKSGDEAEWLRIKDSYSPGVKADLEANSEYWSRYRDTVVYKATSDTYDAFLKSYDQEKGRETYGACVDLLVEYYRRIW